MKKLLLFGLVIFSSYILAQIPTGYYDGAAGLTGAALKTKLASIITNGHSAKSYDNLFTGYPSTDTDKYYENDGSVLDMYTEKPSSADSYNFQHGVKKCGNYSSEGDCYNREHIIPQSFFSEQLPMRGDIHFVTPTDGKVNGMRSNYPFGIITSPTYTSSNGSKLGPNSTTGYSGTVFEPINEFKGDIARMVLYFITRYESKLSGFSTGNMLGGSAFPGLQSWELQVLLAWNNADPVSQREIDRNNAAYTYQGNRNPYIDHPEYVSAVWGGSAPITDTEAPTTPTNLTVINTTASSISLSWNASTDNVGVSAYEIYLDGVFQIAVSDTTGTINGLAPSTTYNFYIIARDAAGNLSSASNTASGTTLAGSGGTPISCGTENFENIPTNTSGGDQNYLARTWTSNGITWNASAARTDQTINKKAITIENGALSSSTISGGISSLKVTTQMKFTGNPGTFNLYINGDMVGQIPYSSTVTTTTIPNINIAGNITINITDNSAVGTGTRGRVAFDDLSWTCYSPLSTNEVEKVRWNIYPNPVKDNILFVNGKDIQKIKRIEIYNISGALVQVVENPFSKGNNIQLRNLNKGVYILKAENTTQKFILE